MKQLLLLLLAFVFFGCSDESPEPELSAEIKGTYKAYVAIIDSVEYPFPLEDTDFLFEIIPKEGNTCTLRTLAIFPDASETGEIEITLMKNGNSIDLLNENQQFGHVTGDIFEFYVLVEDGSRMTIKAKKI